MVAGDTKRIVVIKDISSNLIEEAILILKCEPESNKRNVSDTSTGKRISIGNELILKEAENIINDYINGNKLARSKERHSISKWKLPGRRALINVLINVLLIAAVAFLVYIAGKAF